MISLQGVLMTQTIQPQSTQALFSWADNNKLPEEVFPRDKDKLLSLVKLNLHTQNLSSVPPEISILKNLEELYLSYNNLTCLPKEIGELEKLKVLWVMGNKLKSLPDEIKKLTLLEDLVAFNNKINHISSDILDMPNLKSLFLHDNCLDIDMLENGFISKLEKINSSVYNQIS
jgi:Leucine-rich repeat (LRR) protein